MKCLIMSEDEDLFVVWKPAGLATQSASVTQPDVVSELKGWQASHGNRGTPYVGVVHRLDQPVEGLLAFAKTPAAAAALTKQLTEGVLLKSYVALVMGRPDNAEGELVDWLLKDGNATRVVTGSEKTYPDAKEAMLHYRLLGTVRRGEARVSILEIRIETGRFHQIRAQLSHAGLPILGDQKYGNEKTNELARQYGLRSVGLCACKLSLRHPVTQKMMTWERMPAWIELLKEGKPST